MLISKNMISLALCSVVSLSFFSAPSFSFADSQANKPVAITPLQNILNINLKANPSTGYNWYLGKFNSKFFKFNTYQFTPGSTQMPGAPGQASFSFDISPLFHAAPYLTSIEFTYMRPWDMSTAIHQTLWVLSIPGAPAEVVATPAPAATPAATPAAATTPVAQPAAPINNNSNNSDANNTTTNTTWLSIPTGA